MLGNQMIRLFDLLNSPFGEIVSGLGKNRTEKMLTLDRNQ